jgi:hypothetical protein
MDSTLRAVVLGSSLGLFTFATACTSRGPTSPVEADLALRLESAAASLGPAPYAGVLQPGKFIVCTDRTSGLSAPVYMISVLNSLPSDRSVQSVTVAPGECVVVFATNRRGGPEPSIEVTPVVTFASESVLFDRTSTSVNGVLFGSLVFPGDEVPDFFRILSGFEGAVVKFTNVTETAGGHGGTGTAPF